MKIKKGNHIYKGVFWEWVLWQSESVPQQRDLFVETLEYLLQYNKLEVHLNLRDFIDNYETDPEHWKFWFGGIND